MRWLPRKKGKGAPNTRRWNPFSLGPIAYLPTFFNSQIGRAAGFSAHNTFGARTSSPWTFAIVDTFPSPTDSNVATLLDHLVSHSSIYPSKSQARQAIRNGEILALSEAAVFDPHDAYCHPPVHTSTPVSAKLQLHRITRLPGKTCYPIELTKHVFPPATLQSLDREELVVFETNEIAVLHKPEGMTTIDTKSDRQDLQSLLPFLLSPPSTNNNNNKYPDTQQLPRPVHRLDRGTSGLVLVAKTSSSLRHLSILFAQRKIHKTYTAVVFGQPLIDRTIQSSGLIEYPIDGKSAVTQWKVVESNGEFSRLELHPQTGRYHQLRRHLAYCLGTPIVGDAKYDLVGTHKDEEISQYRRSFRAKGLCLCCNQLDFEYDPVDDLEGYRRSNHVVVPEASSKRMVVSTKLPSKMFDFFGG